jgi:hypothetical protein
MDILNALSIILTGYLSCLSHNGSSSYTPFKNGGVAFILALLTGLPYSMVLAIRIREKQGETQGF